MVQESPYRSIDDPAASCCGCGSARRGAWIPELEVAGLAEAFRTLRSDARDPVLLTALLCPSPAAVLRRLKASNAEIDRAAGLEQGPEEPAALDAAVGSPLAGDVGPAAADLSALWALRHGGRAPWSDTMAEIRRRGDPLTRSDLAITRRRSSGPGHPGAPRRARRLPRCSIGCSTIQPSTPASRCSPSPGRCQ